MASKEVKLIFEPALCELWISFEEGKNIGDNLIVDGFKYIPSQENFEMTLSPLAQEQIIKALVANMELR